MNNRCKKCLSIELMINIIVSTLGTTKTTTCHNCNHVDVETTNPIINSVCLNIT